MKRSERLIEVKYKEKFYKSFSSKGYYYLTDIKGLKKGDLVVVDTIYGTELAKIHKVYSLAETRQHYYVQNNGSSIKKIIVKIPMDDYLEELERIEEEKEAMRLAAANKREKERKIRRVKESIEEAIMSDPILIARAMQDIAGNPKLDRLLNQYDELVGE